MRLERPAGSDVMKITISFTVNTSMVSRLETL
jgi:hypothetical protein